MINLELSDIEINLQNYVIYDKESFGEVLVAQSKKIFQELDL